VAEPKKKTSHSRQGSRRSNIKLKKINLYYCEKCHEPKEPHKVCYNCGTYRGKNVINYKEEEKSDKDMPKQGN